jgi:hypothetical protein
LTRINSAFRREKALAKALSEQTSREKGSARIRIAETHPPALFGIAIFSIFYFM